jgi:hypothetical protein
MLSPMPTKHIIGSLSQSTALVRSPSDPPASRIAETPDSTAPPENQPHWLPDARLDVLLFTRAKCVRSHRIQPPRECRLRLSAPIAIWEFQIEFIRSAIFQATENYPALPRNR